MGSITSRIRWALWALVVLTAVAATAIFVTAPPTSAGIGGGSYSLLDQRGSAVDQTVLQGHPSLMFFGYTHCPDVCPTTMSEMAVWFEALGEDAGDLRAFFVTVDPERDTPAVLGDYVSWVSDRITGLTGSRGEIDKIVQAWRVVAEIVPGEGGEYTINHTASVFLLDRQGRFQGTIAYGEDADTALAKIRRLLAMG